MTDDLVQFLRARLNEDAELAKSGETWSAFDETQQGTRRVDVDHSIERVVACTRSWRGLHIALHDPARVLAEVEAKRQLLELHAPEWDTVEWPHDQDGKGHAQVCRSCGNRDIDSWVNWRPLVGEAGALPEGVKPPYVVAPCPTLRLLALPYADHPDYRPEWRP
jgi:hypothetical protein